MNIMHDDYVGNSALEDRPTIDLSQEAPLFSSFRSIASRLAFDDAFTPFFCGKAEQRAVLDPFWKKVDFMADNVYELIENPDQFVTEFKDAFDAGMDSLITSDWTVFAARGADWNKVCGAVSGGVRRLAGVFGLEQKVQAHIDQWFAFYREHKTSPNLQRARREQLNKEALALYLGSSYARVQPENVKGDVEDVVAANRQRLAEINHELKGMGYDPDPARNGYFTKGFHKAMGRPTVEPKVIIQNDHRFERKNHKAPAFMNSQQPSFAAEPAPEKKQSRLAYADTQLDIASPWTQTKVSPVSQKKKGLFGRAVSWIKDAFRA